MWKNLFEFMMFTFLEKALNLGIFTIFTPVSHSEFQSGFFENLFALTAGKRGENYDLLYQNSIRKYEDDLEH